MEINARARLWLARLGRVIDETSSSASEEPEEAPLAFTNTGCDVMVFRNTGSDASDTREAMKTVRITHNKS